MSRRAPAALGLLGLGAVGLRAWHARSLARETTGEPPTVAADDGVLLHVETGGDGAGPVVVLAHGFASSLREYDGQRGVLEQSHRLVLFDQRGHGRSGWGDHRRATVEQLGRDLEAVIEQTSDGRPVVVVGHSLGGMAVLALADQRPDLFGSKVVGAALLSTSAGQLVQAELPRAVARLMVLTGVARAVLGVVWLLAPVIDRVDLFRTDPLRRWLAGRLFGSGWNPTWAVDEMQRLWAGTSRSMAASFYPAMAFHDKADALNVFSSVPTLVLTGTDDATIPAAHSRRLADRIGPSAELVEIAGAGHMVNVTHPDEINEALERLLRRAQRRGGAA